MVRTRTSRKSTAIGCIQHSAVTLAAALIRERVGLEELADGIWAAYFYSCLLGHLNERERHAYGVHVRQHTPPPDR